MQHIQVELTNGGYALIDEQDEELVLGRSWYWVASKGARYAKTGKNERMHRIILGIKESDVIVDHINGDGLDNRRSNLRLISSAENVKNRQRSRAGYKYPGVYPEKGLWVACVTNNYKKTRIGYFETEDEAGDAVNKFRISIGRPPIFS